MPAFLEKKPIKYFILDLDYTFYEKTKELNDKVWKEIEEAQIQYLMKILRETDYEKFKADFHHLGKKYGYFNAFIALGGTKTQFEDFIKNVDVSQFLAYDHLLAVVLGLLAQQAKLFIFSGSPVASIEKVLAVLLGKQRENLEIEIIGKEFLEARGLQKTEKAAYEAMLVHFGVIKENEEVKQEEILEEVVVIDDLGRSLKVGSEEIGLKTIHINPEKGIEKTKSGFSLPRLREILKILKFY